MKWTRTQQVSKIKNRYTHSREKAAENDRVLARPCPTEKISQPLRLQRKMFSPSSKFPLIVYSPSSCALHHAPAQWELWPQPPTVFPGGKAELRVERSREEQKVMQRSLCVKTYRSVLTQTMHWKEVGYLTNRWSVASDIPLCCWSAHLRFALHFLLLSPLKNRRVKTSDHVMHCKGKLEKSFTTISISFTFCHFHQTFEHLRVRKISPQLGSDT